MFMKLTHLLSLSENFGCLLLLPEWLNCGLPVYKREFFSFFSFKANIIYIKTFCYCFCPSKMNFQASAKVIVNQITVSGVCHISCLPVTTFPCVPKYNTYKENFSCSYTTHCLKVTVKMDYNCLFEMVTLVLYIEYLLISCYVTA